MNGPAEVVLLWRPGCVFCSALRRRLDGAGLDYEARDIWQDPEAAALVRTFAGGSETVPTVVVDGQGMVDPTARQVLEVVHRAAPERLPAGYEPPPPGRLARFVTRLLGGGSPTS